ncbi:cytochrome ubiquinol oxidase subunit I [Mycolicibacterium smegmatis]|uniref:cytochrome ubiquinol oxidase subunit I n=1 Tax=Mycolicibacterium smegmatis TaxID=1772 RepID=UPI0005D88037|nr:cytochrome ubiquinol oxidase subunit I [Mycolicibacterium smegmatis]MCP2626984.1 cytochrome ubiquinol oxidase subunit I [Mycolicibacterium smegmatis]MDF1901128.1 cytochrome ubiquinol oxidase subunit I [Mycolicibacterium smegmatis]MDF1907366.1 cytochrome ubiquinol oxidase subunit I [Mycolicibacterium smegmatis]MDF1919905.1 cytochrome ubiquinol oxidase subunit I [Mycolicibacterium smegmatis]MDF1925662.1 cytochrome ubiquinol oxidase subunit I [Mycolicibacterium smegmatis]
MVFTETLLLLAADGEPPGLLPARQQMAFSLGWHIVLACFGVAFPTMIFVVHRRGIVRDDAVALGLAQRWAKVSAVLFAIGAVSGTVLSFEMGLLWPGLMGRFGDVLGLPFAFEGLSFFVEAIFLGIYLYGWGRMPPRRHLLTLIPMGLAGIVGTFCVVSVNAWMNNPAGFRIVNGEVVDIDPWRAMFNSGVWLQFAHMWVAAFMLVGLVVSGVYAFGMLRGRVDTHHRLGFAVPFTFASVAAVAQPLIGHVLGMRIHDTQPAKLAAFELAQTTEGPAPLRLGGVLIDGEVHWALTIPRLGSIIARNSLDAPVPGLDGVPRSEWPPVNITHLAFQSMVGIGTLLAAVAVVYWLARWRGRDLLANRWFLRLSVITGPLAVLAVESGWVATEVGRQPWTVWKVLTTTEAASQSSGLWWSYVIVLVVYLGMTIGAVVVLRSMARRWRAGETDLPSPYGPPRTEARS